MVSMSLASNVFDGHMDIVITKLHALPLEQRPRKQGSLGNWLRHSGCCRYNVELPGGATTLAQSMLPLLKDDAELWDAIAPVAGCVGELGANTDEPAAKRMRVAVERNLYGDEAAVALGRLRHYRAMFCKQPLTSRVFWLQTQARNRTRMQPDAIIVELVRRSVISISTNGTITYEVTACASLCSPTSTQLEAKEIVDSLCPFYEVSVGLGEGELQLWRKESLLKGDLRKLASSWCHTVVASSAMRSVNFSAASFDIVKAKLAKCDVQAQSSGKEESKGVAKRRRKGERCKPERHMHMIVQLRTIAPAQTATLFCKEVKNIAEAAICNAHSPLQIKLGIRRAALPTKHVIESLSSYRIEELSSTPSKEEVDGNDMHRTCLAGPQSDTCELMLLLPRDIQDSAKSCILKLLEMLGGRSPAFVLKLTSAIVASQEQAVLHAIMQAVSSKCSITWRQADSADNVKLPQITCWPGVGMLQRAVCHALNFGKKRGTSVKIPFSEKDVFEEQLSEFACKNGLWANSWQGLVVTNNNNVEIDYPNDKYKEGADAVWLHPSVWPMTVDFEREDPAQHKDSRKNEGIKPGQGFRRSFVVFPNVSSKRKCKGKGNLKGKCKGNDNREASSNCKTLDEFVCVCDGFCGLESYSTCMPKAIHTDSNHDFFAKGGTGRCDALRVPNHCLPAVVTALQWHVQLAENEISSFVNGCLARMQRRSQILKDHNLGLKEILRMLRECSPSGYEVRATADTIPTQAIIKEYDLKQEDLQEMAMLCKGNAKGKGKHDDFHWRGGYVSSAGCDDGMRSNSEESGVCCGSEESEESADANATGSRETTVASNGETMLVDSADSVQEEDIETSRKRKAEAKA